MIPCFAYLSRWRAGYFSGAMLHTIFIVKDNYVCNLYNLMLLLCILSAILALMIFFSNFYSCRMHFQGYVYPV